jgi:hypothetical protein
VGKLAPQASEERKLSGIEGRIPAGHGPGDQAKSDGGTRPTELVDRQPFEYPSLDPPELGVRHADATAGLPLAGA